MNRRVPKTRHFHFNRLLRAEAGATERRLWELLRNRQLLGYKFRRRSMVQGYIPDFWCPEASLVVEIDGIRNVALERRNARRDTELLALGIMTVHVPSELIWTDLPRVIELIERHLRESTRSAEA